MLTLKEKLAILDAVNSKAFSYDRMQEYLEYTLDPSLAKPILKRIFAGLVLLDTEISAAHDTLDEEDWDALFGAYETPLSEELVKLKSSIELFGVIFDGMASAFARCRIEDIFDIIAPLFRNKTRNVQFILFKIPEAELGRLFGFLMAKLRKEPRVYVPFYCSLLARWSFQSALRERCINAYLRYFRSLKLAKSMECTVAGQYLLYLFCFNRGYFSSSADARDAANQIFSIGLHRGMNGSIVERFCDLFGYGHGSSLCNLPECLTSFPFDWPICGAIQESIAGDYIKYSDGPLSSADDG